MIDETFVDNELTEFTRVLDDLDAPISTDWDRLVYYVSDRQVG